MHRNQFKEQVGWKWPPFVTAAFMISGTYAEGGTEERRRVRDLAGTWKPQGSGKSEEQVAGPVERGGGSWQVNPPGLQGLAHR